MRLEDEKEYGCWLADDSFNSKLVRLEVVYDAEWYDLLDKFQFQIGAIRRADRRDFYGRINCVSIPNWFD